jgi:ubiquinone/menaquinone biosynthesis C-methylase UbiE
VSLSRIVEPELMDTEDDALEYHAMDFWAADKAFADAALALVGDVAQPEIADFGTGTAKIPVLMGKRRKDLRILAMDPAAEMLKVARTHVAENGLDRVVALAKLDGRATGLAEGRFDFVMCNSTVHHMHDPLALLREMKRVLRPGGGVLLRDLERPASMDDAWSIVKRVAAGDSMKQQQLFFDSLCASLTRAEVRRLLGQIGWGDLEVTKSSDRHWSVSRSASRRTA